MTVRRVAKYTVRRHTVLLGRTKFCPVQTLAALLRYFQHTRGSVLYTCHAIFSESDVAYHLSHYGTLVDCTATKKGANLENWQLCLFSYDISLLQQFCQNGLCMV